MYRGLPANSAMDLVFVVSCKCKFGAKQSRSACPRTESTLSIWIEGAVWIIPRGIIGSMTTGRLPDPDHNFKKEYFTWGISRESPRFWIMLKYSARNKVPANKPLQMQPNKQKQRLTGALFGNRLRRFLYTSKNKCLKYW